MPIFQIQGALYYFAHVPKSGGSSVEQYLALRHGPLGFLDRKFLGQDAAWTRSSPQHAAWEDVRRLIPPQLLRDSFAMVRNPFARIRSVFLYQRDLQFTVPADMTFLAWLQELPDKLAASPNYLDNHARPMVDIVPPQARVFRLEKGMAPVERWLSTLDGARAPDPGRGIGHEKNYAAIMATGRYAQGPEATLCPDARAIIARLYRDDFLRFGYSIDLAGAPSS